MGVKKQQRPVDPRWVSLDDVMQVLGEDAVDSLYSQVLDRLSPDFDMPVLGRFFVSRDFLAKFVKESAS